MNLPEDFIKNCKNIMDDEFFCGFMESYKCERTFGLRVNTLKISVDDFIMKSPFNVKNIPWSRDGFYYNGSESPGKHPFYSAGLYYIQEPSAMYPAEVLDPMPNERVLDLCAAPGGKTVQMASFMQNKGVIVSNDINPKRLKALVKNIELAGIKNAVVTNEAPVNLARTYPEYFDGILVDAPCSGEGMFRKDPDAVKSWGQFKNESCSMLQGEILEQAHTMLRHGGRLVYSTCTFSPKENEQTIASFIRKHPEYEILDIDKKGGISDGKPEWADGNPSLKNAARLWPHKITGEGHFVVKLQKGNCNKDHILAVKGEKAYIPEEINTFFINNMKIGIEGNIIKMGNHVYILPEGAEEIPELKIAKAGWYLGKLEKGRFDPSHSLLMGLAKFDFSRTIDFDSDSDMLVKYLKGETLILPGEKGYTAVCAEGFPVGWAKQTGQMVKNLYPKGWRKMA